MSSPQHLHPPCQTGSLTVVRGKAIARSDLHSLAAVWHEMLAGSSYPPFRRGEFDARLAILEEEPKLPLRGVPASWSSCPDSPERPPGRGSSGGGRSPGAYS